MIEGEIHDDVMRISLASPSPTDHSFQVEKILLASGFAALLAPLGDRTFHRTA
jgi:hypothetical protein